ncbi:copper resistance CopC family protein [Plantactinospora soyae]|uniref:Methionine-rich copper-binding protein CopC n=1 Tax=Plantactinospora soyae TaxID=1544732 RepID=A0A927M704_9ACTN|nr:copper resistance CopC family protein [Plantactinospora soyae]MBE1489333.1 methionine-rich copper-binding protein CopC [Plantactinospora soyae]
MGQLPGIPRRTSAGLRTLASAATIAVLATAVAVLAAAPPAVAHGTLAMSTPAEGATVNGPLTAVELHFTEKVASNAYFTITAPGGGRVDNGWTYGAPTTLAKPVREYFLVEGKFEPREYTTGFPALVTVAHLPAAGQYSVSYLSVASDGDPVRGTLTFRYSGRPTPAPKDWRPPTNQPDPALLAAAERHGTSGQGTASSTASAAPAGASALPTATAAGASVPPAAAPPATQADEGGPGWLGWTGWAVAIAVVVAGLGLWRSGRIPGSRSTRSGRSRPVPVRGARLPEPRRGGAGRAGSGSRRATVTGDAKSAGPAVASGAGPRAKGAAAGRKRAVVPAVGKGGAVLTARAPADPVDDPTPPAPAESDVDAPGLPRVGPGLSNTRLALLAGGLVVALLAGFGLGRLGAGDGRTAGTPASAPAGAASAQGDGPLSATDGHQHAPGTGPHSHRGDTGATLATGTAVSAGGYTLQPARRSQPAGASADYSFRIVGTDRRPATRFAVMHDKPLHMIVVGRDLAGYQHLHPTMAPDGTWTVPLRLARAGGYRVYADFTVTGGDGTQVPLVLGVDHVVPGAHTPVAVPAAQPQTTAGPFTVAMAGTPTVGVTAPMTFRVNRTDGTAPAQLERYLGAYGHLVVVREGDLGYVHVHPELELVDGAVKFWLTTPSAGRYRAFFDFQVAGQVHTAEYTMDVG